MTKATHKVEAWFYNAGGASSHRVSPCTSAEEAQRKADTFKNQGAARVVISNTGGTK